MDTYGDPICRRKTDIRTRAHPSLATPNPPPPKKNARAQPASKMTMKDTNNKKTHVHKRAVAHNVRHVVDQEHAPAGLDIKHLVHRGVGVPLHDLSCGVCDDGANNDQAYDPLTLSRSNYDGNLHSYHQNTVRSPSFTCVGRNTARLKPVTAGIVPGGIITCVRLCAWGFAV